MFTGLVRNLGKIARTIETETGRQVDIVTGDLQMLTLGASVAVNGVCLTAIDLLADGFTVDISAETLKCTTLGGLTGGAAVNLEPALSLQDPLGGHMVSGHVDGVGRVVSVTRAADTLRLHIQLPVVLMRYVARKGSICVDGVSLTVNNVTSDAFEVMIIPHTLRHTNIGTYEENTPVNIEVDMLARYVERLLLAGNGQQQSGGITREFLTRYGYLSVEDKAVP